MEKICEWCKKTFEVSNTVQGRKRRFCSTRCSAFWRNSYYGPNLISEETKKKNAKMLSDKWKDADFRHAQIERMYNDNPVHKEGVAQRIREKRLQNGTYSNNFKCENGKISPHEQLVYDFLIKHGFYYNYAIDTKLARDAFPEKHYSKNYKPDFVNIRKKICIEIDGNNHKKAEQIKLDKKKDECLQFLGFTVVRFTPEQVENKKVEEFINGKIIE